MNAADLSLDPEVLQHIRHAAAAERAAGGHEDKYSNNMKSAGASMYAAFRTAMLAQPDYRGRKVEEHVVRRVYESTRPRPWWDAYLVEAKFTDEKGTPRRDTALRLIQWHLDPEAAIARRAQGQLQQAAAQKKLRQQRATKTRGMTSCRESSAPNTAAMRELAADLGHPEDAPAVTVNDLLGELARMNAAVRKIEPGSWAEALEALKTAARAIERYVP